MNRPKNMQRFKEMDLKLGIKSSLKKAKSTLALVILLWLSNDKKAELEYSIQELENIRLSEVCKKNLTAYLEENLNGIDMEILFSKIEKNCLFKSQIESLMVGLELVWKIAKIRFTDKEKANSAERTGNARYEKVIIFTSNIDLLEAVMFNNSEYLNVLLAWLQEEVTDPSYRLYEDNLIRVLTCLSEDTICKLRDGEEDIVFNIQSIYDALESVDTKHLNIHYY